MIETPFIDRGDALRLCIALISDFQRRRIRDGRMPANALVDGLVAGASTEEARMVQIDEDTLVIDSLARLDLVMEVNRFFNLHETGIEDYLLVRTGLGDWAELVADHFTRVGPDAKLTFCTSGSTGPAKPVTLSRARLDGEARALATLLPPAGGDQARIVAAVAPHHVYGFLWGVLLPHHSEREPVDRYRGSPQSVARACRDGDVVLGTPYLYERFATEGPILGGGVTAVSSGGPTTAATWRALADLGVEAALEVYGSTETGGVGFRRAPADPFALLPHLQASDGVIVEPDGAPLELQDRIRWTGPREFLLEGRKDGIVQVAGTNVDIGLVERTLLATDLVDGVAVRLDGDRLKAFIVPKVPGDQEVDLMVRRALAALPAVARPDRISYGTALPVSDIGKPSDW